MFCVMVQLVKWNQDKKMRIYMKKGDDYLC